jgi:hypothetical protein
MLQRIKNYRIYELIIIIIIPLKSILLLLRVMKSKEGVYDLQWLHRYASNGIYDISESMQLKFHFMKQLRGTNFANKRRSLCRRN